MKSHKRKYLSYSESEVVSMMVSPSQLENVYPTTVEEEMGVPLEQQLWQAVLKQALMDAFLPHQCSEAQKRQAIMWLRCETMVRRICLLGGFDYDWVRTQFIKRLPLSEL